MSSSHWDWQLQVSHDCGFLLWHCWSVSHDNVKMPLSSFTCGSLCPGCVSIACRDCIYSFLTVAWWHIHIPVVIYSCIYILAVIYSRIYIPAYIIDCRQCDDCIQLSAWTLRLRGSWTGLRVYKNEFLYECVYMWVPVTAMTWQRMTLLSFALFRCYACDCIAVCFIYIFIASVYMNSYNILNSVYIMPNVYAIMTTFTLTTCESPACKSSWSYVCAWQHIEY